MRIFITISLFLFLLPASSFALAFNMDEAPLKDFVTWVASTTGKNIILSSDVEKTLTVHVKKIRVSEVWPFFEEIINTQNLQLSEHEFFHLVSLPPVDAFVSPASDLSGPDLVEPTTGKIYDLESVAFASVKSALSSVCPSSKITSISGTQSFYVDASAADHEKLLTVLPVLDVPAKRVLVEAVIMEITSTKYEEVGVSISAILDSADTLARSTFASVQPVGFLLNYSPSDSFQSIVSALNGLSDVNLLSNPRILVNDGVSGSIIVGQNVPFVTGQSVSASSPTDNPFQTIERADVGLSLRVTPKVVTERLIDLMVRQEISSVTPDDIASDLITDKREINTRLSVAVGEWVSLGGLVSEVEELSLIGIPLLMDIPFLGGLFSVNKSNIVKKDLSLLFRVTII